MDDLTRIKQLANIFEDKDPTAFVKDIESATAENTMYRNVLYTGPHIQLVVMSIPAGEEIGEETHEKGDQFIRVESGTGKFVLDGKEHTAKDGVSTVIPQGVKHNVINTGDEPLQLYVIYSPPEHAPETQHKQKPDNE